MLYRKTNPSLLVVTIKAQMLRQRKSKAYCLLDIRLESKTNGLKFGINVVHPKHARLSFWLYVLFKKKW